METWINRQGDDMIGLIDWLIDWLNGKCMMMMGEQSDGWMDGQIDKYMDRYRFNAVCTSNDK